MSTDGNDASWKLYERAIKILDGQANGHALPIIRRLAARRFAPAVNVLSDYVADGKAVAMLRLAARGGDAVSAYNLAITHRNRGDMTAYRMALTRAAKLDLTGDAESELRRFQTRFPEPVMRRLGRLSSSRFRTSANGAEADATTHKYAILPCRASSAPNHHINSPEGL